MFCRVLTECRTADSTEVTWVVNGQSVEASYLDGRALQGGRRCISTFKKAAFFFKSTSLLRRTQKVIAISPVEALRLTVARVTRMSEGCQIELRLIVIAITEKDVNTELRCRTQNQAGRQEVVTHLQLEGKTELSLFNVTVISVCQSCSQMTARGCRLQN